MKLALAITTLLTLIASACSNSTSKTISADHFFDNYKTVVASAPNDGYTPYWLGREFTAGSLRFSGPYVNDFAGEVRGGGLSMTYSADVLVKGTTGAVTLEISVHSASAWETAKANGQAFPANESVTVAGHEGTVSYTDQAPSQPSSGKVLQLTIGQTTVVAIARSGGNGQVAGSYLNPLTDKATFISVLQNLRPYPQ